MSFKNSSISSFFGLLSALLILVSNLGCKSTHPTNKESSTPNETELEELYWARKDSARNSFTQADVKFMTGMICHHAQALVMSRLASENGANTEVQTLAHRIINAQKDEITSMQQWLRLRNQPVPKINIDSLNLNITLSGQPYTEYKKMPGVLARQKLQELAKARGSEFDRLFLRYMIQHHKGAVVMVENLFSTGGAAQDESAYRLASNIQVDQRTEIDRMNLMLDELNESN